jgi:hypothetical protein
LDPVAPEVAERALFFVVPVVLTSKANTDVFPLADGGLLFRWMTDDASIQVEFDAEGDSIVMLDDRVDGTRRAEYLAELWPEALRLLRRA